MIYYYYYMLFNNLCDETFKNYGTLLIILEYFLTILHFIITGFFILL